MVLSKEDAELFYELFFPLLDFVNKKYGINAGVGEIYFGKTLRSLTNIWRRKNYPRSIKISF